MPFPVGHQYDGGDTGIKLLRLYCVTHEVGLPASRSDSNEPGKILRGRGKIDPSQDFANQRAGEVSPTMLWDGSGSPVGMAIKRWLPFCL